MKIDTEENNSNGSSVWQTLTCGSGTKQDRRNLRRSTQWCMLWAAAQIAASAVLATIGIEGIAAWLIALVPSVFAIGALISYLRYLRMADELQRRIQIEGLAVGFGGAWIFAIGYQSLERAGAPDLNVLATILVMTGAWMIGQLIAVRHYR